MQPHPAVASPAVVPAVAARAAFDATRSAVRFEYRLSGDLAALAIPARAVARRADRLWERTCFEAFIAGRCAERYVELNFSPSTEWAAYAFDSYRCGMRPLPLDVPPAVSVAETAGELRVTADLELGSLGGAAWPWRVGLAAVVAARSGARAYFALRHPRDVPDFHDAGGFVLSLDGSAR